MRIDETKCSGCGMCHDVCTMNCIGFARAPKGIVSQVDEDECVDCGVCERSRVCTLDALKQPVSEWPRSLRGTFSNPLEEHKETKVPGRGTEEMKTNDVTQRFKPGFAGFGIELGRPGTGARLRDAGVVAKRLKAIGIAFEPKNPLTSLLDPVTGECLPEVSNEKVLSCIIEFIVPSERVAEVLHVIKQTETEIDTVMSIDFAYKAEPGEESHALREALMTGEQPYPNGKTNVGLGRPVLKVVNSR